MLDSELGVTLNVFKVIHGKSAETMPGTDQVLPYCLLTQTQPSSDISDSFHTNTQGSTFAHLICKIFESFHLHIFNVSVVLGDWYIHIMPLGLQISL